MPSEDSVEFKVWCQMKRIFHTLILQGRYDVCCPMMSAWDLHKVWPEADFKVRKLLKSLIPVSLSSIAKSTGLWCLDNLVRFYLFSTIWRDKVDFLSIWISSWCRQTALACQQVFKMSVYDRETCLACVA